MQRQSTNKISCFSCENGGYKWMAYLVISVWLVALGAGCAASPKVFNYEPHEIDNLDVNKVYPASISIDLSP